MNKRGQVFLIAVIILAIAIYSITIVYNDYEERILLEDFPELSNNYNVEAKKVVSDALISGDTPELAKQDLDTFTQDYVNYARTIDPNIGFVYVYRGISGDQPSDMQAEVKNYLSGDPVNIYYSNDLDANNVDTVFSTKDKALTDVGIDAGGFQFKKSIPINLKNFGDYESVQIPENSLGQLQLEIGGVFYPINLLNKNGLEIITKSASGEERKVSWTGTGWAPVPKPTQ